MTTLLDRPVGRPAVRPDAVEMVEVSRRRFLGGAAAAGALVLGGCGEPGGDAGPAAPGSGFPRTVEHPGGTTRIERRPQRIISTAGENDIDTLLAIGAPVVGVGRRDYTQPWYAGTGVQSIESFETADSPDPERFAALRPDLIIVPDYGLLNAEVIARIAPIVLLPSDIPGMLRVAGQATGLDDVAARRAAEIDAAFAAFTPAWSPRSIAQFSVGSGILGLYSAQTSSSALYRSAGLPALSPPTGDAPIGGFREVSLERAAEYLDVDLAVELNSTSIRDDPVIAGLPVVTQGRAATVDEALAIGFNAPSPLSARLLLAEIGRILEATRPR